MSFKAQFRKKRRLVITAAIFLLLLGLFAIGRYMVLPHYRPELEKGEVYGIDVSSHQKPLDWAKVAADDISFVYVKATEGSGHTDSRFKNHWNGATKAGLRSGAYHYFSLCSPGKSQAKNFLEAMPNDTDMLPPALDLEFSPFCHKELSLDQVRKEIDDFLEIVATETKQTPILYVGDDFDKRYQIKGHYEGYTYWQLRYLKRPTDPRDYIWQVGGFFSIEGAEGGIDLNVGRIDELD